MSLPYRGQNEQVLQKVEGKLTGHWPPINGGYWELQDKTGLQELEVSLRGFQPPIIHVPRITSTMPGRVIPLLHVASAAAWRLSSIQEGQFKIQLHDEDPECENCLRFDAATGDSSALLPDPYALGSHGYNKVRSEFAKGCLPQWKDRLNIAFWRGASTGIKALTMTRLSRNLRYQLCRISKDEPRLLDARITKIVQGRDPESAKEIENHLQQREMMATHCPTWRFALHKYLIEIDGNVNSWGLLWKLLSGSCVLKVESHRRQWYHHKIQPYVHIVPVAKDLSNLTEQINWCNANPEYCEYIASCGRSLAEQEVKYLGKRVLEAVDALEMNG